MVDEAHHCFCSLAHHESRTRCHAIISNEFGLAQVRVDLLLEWLDINLIIINLVLASIEFEIPWKMSVRRPRKYVFVIRLTSMAS
jgi:hypothetical protein